MKNIKGMELTGERALFMTRDANIEECVFFDGESPLKESSNISLNRCEFKWKYPLWYCRDVKVAQCTWHATARSGIWYTENIEMDGVHIDAPKQFRRCKGVTLRKCEFTDALETMWMCRDIYLEDCHIVGDYFGLNCENIVMKNVTIDGNYCFDGAKNVELHHCTLNSKDSFWNCENAEVYDSKIIGEYLGWNSKGLHFHRCHMESNQGFCYIDDLMLDDCTLAQTDLAFEYSTVDAVIHSRVDSVKNPNGGRIVSRGIDELILDENIKTAKEKTVYEVERDV